MAPRISKVPSEIQDKNLIQNPVIRDQAADNSTYTQSNPEGHLVESSTARTGNTIEGISPEPGGRPGGMMGEG